MTCPCHCSSWFILRLVLLCYHFSGPYPPMPKYQPELGTKLIIPEEEIMTEECDTDIPDVWDLENPDHVKVQQSQRLLSTSLVLNLYECINDLFFY